MALLKFKRSAVPAKVPSIADLDLGELAINTYDGKVYTKKDNGTASIVEVGGGSGVTSFNTRTGAVTLSGSDVTTALGYTPANKAGDTFTGDISVPITKSFNCYTVNYGMGTPDSSGLQIYAAAGDTMRFGHRTGGVFTERFIMGTGGNVTANVDFRAPIFYDSNNTGYFLDPAGSSNLLSVQINGTLDVRDSNAQFWRSTNGAYQRVDTRTDATSFSRAHWYGVSSSGGTSNFRHAWYDNAAYFYVTAQDGEIIFNREAGDTIVRSTGSFRAPIFYDSNDTAFFLDPNSTSVLSKVRANAIQHVNGTDAIALTDGSYLYFRSPDNGIRLYLGGADPANYYDNDAHNFRNRSGGKYAEISASGMYASTFYDYQNTAYYVDPASTGTSLITAGGVYVAGQVRAAGWWGEPSASATGLAVEIGESGGRCYITAYSRDAAAYGPMSIEASDFTFTGVSGGFVGVNTSVRAPIFYDSENTARFVDPSSTSVLNVIRGTTLQHSSGQVAVRLNGDTWTEFCDPNGATKLWLGGGDPNNYYNANIHYFRNNGSGNTMTIDSAGTVIATADMRAPIFYDSNNTAYYVDPTTQSYVYEYAGPVTYGSYGSLSIIGQTNNYAGIAFPTKSSTLMMGDGGATPAGFYFGNSAWGMYCYSTGELYTRTIYDLDNTGFYVNPASTSYLNTVSLGAQTWRGDITWNTAVNVVIPASAECSFDVNSSGTWQVWDLTSNAPMIKATAGTNVEIGGAGSRGLYVYGSFTASGNVTAYSDRRLKDNIEQITSALGKVRQLCGVTFTRTDLPDTTRKYAGLLAQDVEKVLPEAVQDVDGKLAVDYNATIGLLVEAIKELEEQVAALKNRS